MQRSPDQHLDAEELNALLAAKDPGYGETADLAAHLRGCEICRQTEAQHRAAQDRLNRLAPSDPQSPTPRCPGDAIWTELASGLMAEPEAAQYLSHAARCDHCGPILRDYAAMFSEPVSSEEQLVLQSLSTSTAKGRSEMAGRITARKSSWRPWMYAAAACLAGFGVFLWRALKPELGDFPLRAYAESRTLELRFAGAAYAPLNQQRGGGAEHSRAWLDGEAALAHLSAGQRDSIEALQAQGRLDLLGWRYPSAIAKLQRALDLSPDSNIILMDLASAYYERAEAEARDADRGVALDLLGRTLNRTLQPEALFNRALLYESTGLIQQAIADWTRYLEIDPKGPWSNEARAHLDSDLKKKAPAPAPLPEPR